MSWPNILFGFRGRINRTKWWLGVLLLLVPYVVIERLTHKVLVEIKSLHPELKDNHEFGAWLLTNPIEMQPLMRSLAVLILLLALVSAWSFVALSAKRLHDRGLSISWCLVLTLPLLVFMLGSLFSPNDPQLVGGVVLLGIALLAVCMILGVLQLGVLKGEAGSNRFGSDPMGGGVGT